MYLVDIIMFKSFVLVIELVVIVSEEDMMGLC